MNDHWWNNTETWKTREGEVLRLEEMEPSHREAVIRFIRRKGESLRWQVTWLFALDVAMHDGGDMAHDALESELARMERQPIAEFMDDLPIIRALFALRPPTMFASRTPRDLNHDPEPWRIWTGPWVNTRVALSIPGMAEFDPRPEYDHVQHNAPNPILAQHLRNAPAVIRLTPDRWLEWFENNMSSGAVPSYITAAHEDHARKVLTRLANLHRRSQESPYDEAFIRAFLGEW